LLAFVAACSTEKARYNLDVRFHRIIKILRLENTLLDTVFSPDNHYVKLAPDSYTLWGLGYGWQISAAFVRLDELGNCGTGLARNLSVVDGGPFIAKIHGELGLQAAGINVHLSSSRSPLFIAMIALSNTLASCSGVSAFGIVAMGVKEKMTRTPQVT
jgi:hypothetical protein